MDNKKKKKGKLKQKLTDKYRLVVLNENTFEERFSLKLSLLNVFVLGGLLSFLLILVTTFFITFTPIKEYIPGYSSTDLKIKATKLAFKTDSLKRKLVVLQNYTKALQPILTGEIEADKIHYVTVFDQDATLRIIDLTKEFTEHYNIIVTVPSQSTPGARTEYYCSLTVAGDAYIGEGELRDAQNTILHDESDPDLVDKKLPLADVVAQLA